MRQIYLVRQVASTILLCCLFALSIAQEAAVDSTLKVTPQAIDLVEISKETQRVRQDIGRIRTRIYTADELSEIDSLFNMSLDEYQVQKSIYQQFRQGSPNKPKLNAHIARWRSFQNKRQRWSSDVRSFLSRSDIARETLEFEKEVWELTYQNARSSSAPSSLVFSVQRTQGIIDSALTDIRNQIDLALNIAARISEQETEISTIIKDLQDWSRSGELNAFYRRHPSIWNTDVVLSEDVDRTDAVDVERYKQDLKEYVEGYQGRLMVFFAFMVVMFGLIYFLRDRLSKINMDGFGHEIDKAQGLIRNKTFATSTYFAIIGATLFLSDTPNIISELLIVLMLITSVVLLKPFIQKRFLPVLVVILIAFILNTLKEYIWFTSFGYRLYQYAEALFAIASVWWFTIPSSKLSTIKKSSLLGVLIHYGTRATLILALGSIIANTFGYTNLADILINVIVTGATISIVAIGIMYVLGGVIGTSMSVYFAQNEDINYETTQIIKERTLKIVRWIAIVLWVTYILISAELFGPLYDALVLWGTEPWVLGEFSITPGNILSFFLVVVIAYAINRTIALAVDGGVLGFLGIQQGILSAISMVIRYLIVGFAVAIGLGALGVDLSKFGLLAGTLGVGLGFGLQNIVSNFISGIILMFERPIEPGDTIEVNATMGVVQKIGVRSSIIRSFDGADVMIPNNTLLSNDLINWTRVDKRKRVKINVGVAYGTDPDMVRQLLLEVAQQHPMVLKEPEPVALFTAFGASSLDFQLLAWSPLDVALKTASELSSAVYHKITDAGIEIPFPRTDVTILNPEKEEDSKDEID